MSWTLESYKPEKVQGSYDILKGTFNATFNYARLETFRDQQTLRYELELCDDAVQSSRRIWGTVYLESEMKDRKGKTPKEQLADTLFTLGLEFKDEASLQEALEKLIRLSVKVYCYKKKVYKKTDDGFEETGEFKQGHIIRELYEEVKVETNPDF